MTMKLEDLRALSIICKKCTNKIDFDVKRLSGMPVKCPACRNPNVPPAASSQAEDDAHKALQKLKDALKQVMVDSEKDLPFHITLEFSESKPRAL